MTRLSTLLLQAPYLSIHPGPLWCGPGASYAKDTATGAALGHESALIRAEVAAGIAFYANKHGVLEVPPELTQKLSKAFSSEPDPFAKSEMLAALDVLAEQEG